MGTGASVEIEGDHPGLYFVIGANSKDIIREAEQSINDLIDAVEDQYVDWLESSGKGGGGGKGNNNRQNYHRDVRVFECADAVGFKLAKMIVGSDRQNFSHVQEE